MEACEYGGENGCGLTPVIDEKALTELWNVGYPVARGCKAMRLVEWIMEHRQCGESCVVAE